MNLPQIIGVIKAFLPKGSPWLERIDQAAEMAKGFSPNKDGISQLMDAYGKNRSDLQKAVGMLENPIVKSALSRMPGLGNLLKDAANDLMKDPTVGSSHSGNGNPGASGNSFDSLQARLNRLK